MNEIPSLTSQRLKSIGIISFVESVIQTPVIEVNPLKKEMIEGLQLAQEINHQIKEARGNIIPEH